MFFNNFINSIIKSMMAVCVVANGWSDGVWAANDECIGRPSYLQALTQSGSANMKMASNNSHVVNRASKGSVTIDRNNLCPDDPLSALLQSGELEKFFSRIFSTTDKLSTSTKILLIKGKLDSVCKLFYSSRYAEYVLKQLLTNLEKISEKDQGALLDAFKHHINIFPTLLKCADLIEGLGDFRYLCKAIINNHKELTGPGAPKNNNTVTAKLKDIVNASSEY